jgi:hypothetical protein
MDRRAFIHAEDAEGLHALRAAQNLRMDASSLVGGLVTTCPEAGHMQKNIRKSVVGDDESVPLGGIEPLDRACDLENLETGNVAPELLVE